MKENINGKLLYKKNNFKIVIIIFTIIIASIGIRLYYFSFDIPLTSDALGYFYYASDIAISGNIPINYTPANSGWSIIVSGFFQILDFETVNEYMQTQKILSIIISTITIIPIYYLCRKFVDQKLSILGCIFFAFEPHLIQNSLLGITDPFYILLITIGLSLILSENKKLILLSFVLISISTFIRSEGFFVFLGFLSIILIREKQNKKKIFTMIFCILIFSMIVIPIAYYKYSVFENDFLFIRINNSVSVITTIDGSNEESRILTSIENFPKYFGWSLIPTFIIFIPIGTISLIKKWNEKSLVIFSLSFFMILPMIYAYSIPLKDTRFVIYLFPILIIISLIGIKPILEKYSVRKLIQILIIIFIVLSSLIFLDWKMDKMEFEKDVFSVSKIIVSSSSGVNSFYPESRFLEAAELPIIWDDYKKYFDSDREFKKSVRSSVEKKVKIFNTENHDSLEDLINNSGRELTHLIVDDNQNRPKFIKEVYDNGEELDFLKKEFDSQEENLNYNVKIFKINYEKLE